MMTRIDLYEWMRHHGCIGEPIENFGTAYAIKIVNPKTKGHTYLDLPLDEKPVKHFLACKACMDLGIEIPLECNYMEPLANHIKDKLHPRK